MDIPLTPNGKVDWSQLNTLAASSTISMDASSGEPLKTLLSEWSSILSVSALDPKQSFIQLGGDSLSYIQASLEVEKVLGWLPDEWEKMPLKSLATIPRRDVVTGHQIGTPILIRAISIVLIVLGHFEIIEVDGSTTALFIIAGWSFGKYQFRAIVDRQSVTPLFGTIFQIMLPAALYTSLLQLKLGQLHWQSLLLVSNFISPFFDNGSTYWFIEVLVQILLVLAGLFSLKSVRDWVARDSYWGAIILGLVAFAVRAVSEEFWDTGDLYHRVPHYYLSIVFLGMAVAYSDTRPKKILLSCIVAALAISGQLSLFAFAATQFVLWVRKLPLPLVLVRPINYLAIASLFIYLTHFQFASVLRHTPVGNSAVACAIFALSGGVLVWKFWDWLRAHSTIWLYSALSSFTRRRFFNLRQSSKEP
jgi:acyl carrier protein